MHDDHCNKIHILCFSARIILHSSFIFLNFNSRYKFYVLFLAHLVLNDFQLYIIFYMDIFSHEISPVYPTLNQNCKTSKKACSSKITSSTVTEDGEHLMVLGYSNSTHSQAISLSMCQTNGMLHLTDHGVLHFSCFLVQLLL